MTDEYDHIRQNPDIKKMARKFNKLKQNLDSNSSSIVNPLNIEDTRTEREKGGTSSSKTSSIVSSASSTNLLDEDDMASDSDTRGSTQQSIKAYVDNETWHNDIHSDVAAEISTITSKPIPVGADELLIEDSADSFNKKSVTIAEIEAILDHDKITGVSASDHHTKTVSGDIDHGSVTGLGDDDHTQYLRTDGTRALSGNLSAGSNKITTLASPTAGGDAATKDYVDNFVTGLDWQESVLDKDLTTPPVTPSTGDRYIVAATATGDWTGHEDEIAEYDGTNWIFEVPNEGFSTRVEDEDIQYTYNGTSWIKFASTIDHGTLAGLSDDDHTQYHNDARALTWLGTRSTSDLSEGTNLYYTDARADARIATASIGDVSDVNLTGLNDDDVLSWDATAGEFVKNTVAGLQNDLALDDLTDVVIATPANRDVVVYDGTDWDNRALVEADISDLGTYLTDITAESIGDLSDVDLTGLADNDYLIYNTATGNFESTATTNDYTDSDVQTYLTGLADVTIDGADKLIFQDNSDTDNLKEESVSDLLSTTIGNLHTKYSISDDSFVETLLMHGSGNAGWVSCVAEGDASGNFAEVRAFGGIIKNNGSTNMNISYVLPLPPSLGSLNLVISGIRIHVVSADADDYINRTRVFKVDQSVNSHTVVYDDNTNLTSSGLYEDGGGTLSTFTILTSIGANDRIGMQLLCDNTTQDDLQIGGVFMKCYYE